MNRENILLLKPENLRKLKEKYTIRQIARWCGLSENTIYSRLQEYNIMPKKFFCRKCSKRIRKAEIPWCEKCRIEIYMKNKDVERSLKN